MRSASDLRRTDHRRTWQSGLVGAVILVLPRTALAEPADGLYGRFDGDLSLGAEIGVTETIGDDASRGESMALRFTALYLSTAGIFGQYNESMGSEDQPIARAVVAGFEIRPLFLGRWGQDMQHGPALLDLWVDSISLTLGLHHLWRQEEHCEGPYRAPCHDFGMEVSVGMELPFLERANTPFLALRGGLRWSLNPERPPALSDEPRPPDEPNGGPMGLLTLTVGYHHLFETHVVDAGDRL